MLDGPNATGKEHFDVKKRVKWTVTHYFLNQSVSL